MLRNLGETIRSINNNNNDINEGFYHCNVKNCEKKFASIDSLSSHVLSDHYISEKNLSLAPNCKNNEETRFAVYPVSSNCSRRGLVGGKLRKFSVGLTPLLSSNPTSAPVSRSDTQNATCPISPPNCCVKEQQEKARKLSVPCCVSAPYCRSDNDTFPISAPNNNRCCGEQHRFRAQSITLGAEVLLTNQRLMTLIKGVNPFERNFRQANEATKVLSTNFRYSAPVPNNQNIPNMSNNNNNGTFAILGQSRPLPSNCSSSTVSVGSSSELPGLCVKLPPEDPPILIGGTEMDTPDITNLVSQVSRDDNKIVPPTADVLTGVLELRESRKDTDSSFEPLYDIVSPRFRDIVPTLSSPEFTGSSPTISHRHQDNVDTDPATSSGLHNDIFDPLANHDETNQKEQESTISGLGTNQMVYLRIRVPDNTAGGSGYRILPVKLNNQSASTSGNSGGNSASSNLLNAASLLVEPNEEGGTDDLNDRHVIGQENFSSRLLLTNQILPRSNDTNSTTTNENVGYGFRRIIPAVMAKSPPPFSLNDQSSPADSNVATPPTILIGQKNLANSRKRSYGDKRHVTIGETRKISYIVVKTEDYLSNQQQNTTHLSDLQVQSGILKQNVGDHSKFGVATSSAVDLDEVNNVEIFFQNSDGKKQDTLDRNKLAASRYRKRKKMEMDFAASRVKKLENEKLELTIQAQVLRDELNRVTKLLYDHVTGPNCKLKQNGPDAQPDSAVLIDNSETAKSNDGKSVKIYKIGLSNPSGSDHPGFITIFTPDTNL